ncbi:MAG: polysaccharide biosynthesis protein [Planctomycetota bacterium]
MHEPRPSPPPPAGRAESDTAILIGTAAAVRSLRCQLFLHELDAGPAPWPCGCILTDHPTGPNDAPPPEPGLPVLGGIDDLPELHAWHKFGRALITMPADRAAEAEALSETLARLNVETSIIPTLDDLLDPPRDRSHGASPSAGGIAVPGAPIDPSHLIGREPFPVDEAALTGLIRNKRVLVTGAGGSIGSEISAIVARFAPERIVLVERSENALFEIDRRIKEAHQDIERASILHDIVDADGTDAYLREHRPHVVFHAAAHKHVPLMEDHPAHAVTNNLFGTKAVADAAVNAGCERFVMISSDKAVNPTSVMGATKRLAERYIQGLQSRSPRTRFSMVRFGNVLASACSVLPIWSSQLAEGRPITVTDERMTRYFMTIPEAASLVIQSAAIGQDSDGLPPSARVYVLDMGEPVRIMDLAERFCRARGVEPAAAIRVTGIRPGEKLYEELAYAAESLEPTSRPGINAWAGEGLAAVDLDRLVADLGKVRASRDRVAVVKAIRSHVPEMRPTTNAGRRETPAPAGPIHSSAAA